MTRYYTGIGSRKSPTVILLAFEKIASILAEKGYTLRSGGADGADSAFEKGCLAAGGKMEVYLPWGGFNGRSEKNDGYYCLADSLDIYQRAKEIASSHHPAWDQLSDGVKKLHTRNVHQVLGLDLQSPSDFVICYAEKLPNGQWKGGTGQALRIAESLNIKIYSFANDNNTAECLSMLKSN